VDQVKFVKPVKAEVTEEPPKIVEIKEKKLGAETIKGDPDAVLSVAPVGNGRNNKLLKRITKSTTMLVSRLNLNFQEGWINFMVTYQKLSCAGRRGFER
jgi:hypothetical protein